MTLQTDSLTALLEQDNEQFLAHAAKTFSELTGIRVLKDGALDLEGFQGSIDAKKIDCLIGYVELLKEHERPVRFFDREIGDENKFVEGRPLAKIDPTWRRRQAERVRMPDIPWIVEGVCNRSFKIEDRS